MPQHHNAAAGIGEQLVPQLEPHLGVVAVHAVEVQGARGKPTQRATPPETP